MKPVCGERLDGFLYRPYPGSIALIQKVYVSFDYLFRRLGLKISAVVIVQHAPKDFAQA